MLTRRRFLAASLLALAVLCAPFSAWSATFYVDCNSTAGGDGTTQATTGANRAWATVAAVNGATFSAGDSILLKTGCTWRETLTPPSSGSAGSPITFGAYGEGDAPVLTGLDVLSGFTPAASQSTVGEWGPSIYNDGPIGANWRDVLPANSFAQNGTSIVIRLRANTAHASTVTEMYIGEQDTGNGWNMKAGTIAQLLFSTNAGVVISAGAYQDTDALTYAIDKTKAYVISIGIDDYWILYQGLAGTLQSYIKFNAEDAAEVAAPTGYTAIDAGEIAVVYSATVSAASATVWETAVATDPNVVLFDGTVGTEVASVAAVNGANKWFWDTDTLYVYSAADPDTAYTTPGIEAGVRGAAINITEKSYITVDGLDTYGARINNVHIASTNVATSHVTIQNIIARAAGEHGIHVANEHATYKTTDVLIDSNEVYDCGRIGISLTVGVNDTTISRNTVYRNHRSGSYRDAGIRLWGNGVDNHGVIIEYNTVYDTFNHTGFPIIGGVGIWLDQVGGSPSPIVRYNHVYGNEQSGIFVEDSDGVEVYYNLAYGNGGNPTGSGAGIYIYRSAEGNHVYNNVAYDNDEAGIIVSGNDATERGMIGNLVKNNISVGNLTHQLITRFGGENDGTMGSGNVYEYNALGVEAANFIEWGNGVHKSTYDLWETAYGGTTHSIEADPLLVNAATGDFRLQAASPARDAGVDVGLTTDYAGGTVPFPLGGVDIGAYEKSDWDIVPTAFALAPVTSAARSTQYTSNPITVAGVDYTTAIAISGGAYAKNGGAYTASTGTVVAGDTITVRATSSASYATPVSATLTIGTVSDTYSVTTGESPAQPGVPRRPGRHGLLGTPIGPSLDTPIGAALN